MADYSGTARSNYFRVKDKQEFITWCESLELKPIYKTENACEYGSWIHIQETSNQLVAAILNNYFEEFYSDLDARIDLKVANLHPVAAALLMETKHKENQTKEGGGVDTINGKGSIVCKSCGHDPTHARILFGKSAIKFHRSLHARSAPTIICAAIWYDDKITTHKHQPKNIKSGYVVAGRRHHNCIATHSILRGTFSVLISSIPPASAPTGTAVLTGDPLLPDERTGMGTALPAIQGFLTSDDRFVCREEAGEVAFKAGQIPRPTDCLMSEDLY